MKIVNNLFTSNFKSEEFIKEIWGFITEFENKLNFENLETTLFNINVFQYFSLKFFSHSNITEEIKNLQDILTKILTISQILHFNLTNYFG